MKSNLKPKSPKLMEAKEDPAEEAMESPAEEKNETDSMKMGREAVEKFKKSKLAKKALPKGN